MYTKYKSGKERMIDMKARNRWIAVFLVLFLAILLTIAYIVSKFLPNDSSSEVKHWRQEAEKLQKENAELKSDLKEKTDKVSELEEKLSASEKKVDKLSKQLASSNGQSDNEILALLFPTMEYPYEIRDSTKFYSDPSCHEKYLIDSKLTFTGFTDKDYEYYDKVVDTKFNYFISKTFEKGFVFSKRQPMLFAIK